MYSYSYLLSQIGLKKLNRYGIYLTENNPPPAAIEVKRGRTGIKIQGM